MSDVPQGPGWWQASDGRWYAPGAQSGGFGAGPMATPPYIPVTSPTNSSATASLVLGIVSIFMCGLLTGIPAIIFGAKARKEIQATGNLQQGDGMAMGGIITGVIGTALSVIGIIAFIALVALGSSLPEGDINSDPSDGICNEERFLQDPDC